MRLTLQTDYALRVGIYLAENPDRLCSIAEISGAYRISHNHLMKVVHGLVKGGFVASVRGRAGGIRLARPASEITIGAIVRHMEDGFDLVDCGACIVSPACGLRGLLGRAAGAFLAVLDACTLADLQHGPASITQLLKGLPLADSP